MKAYSKPKNLDRNLLVIGGGSAGLVSAYIAAAVKARVSLVEADKMGGDCLNTGCVPSKALIRTARFIAEAKRAEELGIRSVELDFSFSEIMERIQTIIQEIEPHDSVARYQSLGVDVIQGKAHIHSPYEVEVNGQGITSQNLIIATGARPAVPPIAGLDEVDYLTSDNLWQLKSLPGSLLVLGGGPIGCEIAQCFRRFGSDVTILEMADSILANEDKMISQIISKKFEQEGIKIQTQQKAISITRTENGVCLVCEQQGQTHSFSAEKILVATGRSANTQGFGLEELGLEMNPTGTIATNARMQTNISNIYACGDVAGPYQFTHAAAHQAWYCAVNALFSPFARFKINYDALPFATFTDPEVASVGLNEKRAQRAGIQYEVTEYNLADLDRAIIDSAAEGIVRVLTVPGKDRILGASIVSQHASEYLTEFTSAIKHGHGLNSILGTIHIYPTLSEANKYAAGNWKRQHAPKFLLKCVEKLLGFKRQYNV